jgi:ABC-type nitrate/sulfonate/bicarbonate transport system permease component
VREHPADPSNLIRVVPAKEVESTTLSGRWRRRGRRVRTQRLRAPLLLLAGLVVAWEVLVRVLGTPDYLLPAPSAVAAALGRDASVLAGHAVATTTTALLGLALGATVGVVLAGVMTASERARAALYPLVVVSQSVPMVVLAPLFVVWFGFGLLPRVLVVALVAFFPVAVSTVDGLLSADRDQVDLLRSMGARRSDVARHVLVPGALPSLATGLTVAASYAMFGAVVGEWIGASEGLGLYLERSRASFATDQMFAAVVVIAAVSVALVGSVLLAQRLLLPWRRAEQQRARAMRVEGAW